MSIGEPTSASQPPPAAAATAPGDADALRGFHFKRLLRKPLTIGLTTFFTVGAAAGALALSAPLFALVAAVAAFVVCIAVVFAIADSLAANSFFDTYAQSRGLTLGGRGPLPPATPLLRRGDDRYAERTLTGTIAEGTEGTLALYTYEEETNNSDGSRQTSYYRYTLGLVEVPECAAHVPELYCRRKFGLRALEGFEDFFRRSKQRVKLESAVLDDKYEIFAGKEQDAVWLRRLFTPTFIVWLTDSAPEKFAFELVDGALCCYLSGHKEDAADLDEIAAATGAVARRLRDEATE